ncbi:5-aminolevulinate synthase [Massarina eburnea CBS 473.64]|uniref:5-aminolevulinate synthase n=1 Tax=Massarina eburnea CBS 473.64 TaxID=1395130 RepID=A0A6A6SDE2_9PLEO|nr:5-aminolevulinate synthase [Massarina eburnea CBS 473.64]
MSKAAGPYLSAWWRNQQLRAPAMKLENADPFHRNLEEALDVKRKQSSLYSIIPCQWKTGDVIDFTSNDTLSLGSSGALRKEFDKEMETLAGEPIGAAGSRIVDGNSNYMELVEQEVADFHGAESSIILASGFEANIAIFSAIPRPGDVIVYDEFVHASMYDGLERTLAVEKIPFRHNDADALRHILENLVDTNPLIRQGKKCVIIALESVYSMDGDVCPLADLVETAKDCLPLRNKAIVVDEAHSAGLMGAKGEGLVSMLGLEKDVEVRVHAVSKAIGVSGAVVMGSQTIRIALVNLARNVIFSTAPSLPVVAGIRASYNLMKRGATKENLASLQKLVHHFHDTITSHPSYQQALDQNIIAIPLFEDWEDRTYQTHVIPVWTPNQDHLYLAYHLNLSGFSSFPVEYPVVPKGQGRVRLAFHAGNTLAEVERLVTSVMEWAAEMMRIEDEGLQGDESVPTAARVVFESLEEGVGVGA